MASQSSQAIDKVASQSSREESTKMPWPAYKEIFDLKPHLSNEKNWAFLCKICIGNKVIHASKTSTANLRKHISIFKKHTNLHETFNFESNTLHKRELHGNNYPLDKS